MDKTKKSRDAWKAKCKERASQVKSLANQLEHLRQMRDTWRKRYQDATSELRQALLELGKVRDQLAFERKTKFELEKAGKRAPEGEKKRSSKFL